MKHLLRNCSFALFLVLTINYAQAQTKNITDLRGVLTADSLASGNMKDIMISFFQLSFNKLTGPKKELNFASNPFAILLKNNPQAAIDTNYQKYKVLRKLNFGFGLTLDTSYRFSGFSSGIKYALINQRDTTTSRLLFRELGNDSLSIEMDSLQRKLNEYIESAFPNKPENLQKRIELSNLVNTLFTDVNIPFNKLDTAFQSTVKLVAANNHLNRFLSMLRVNPKLNLTTESRLTFSELKSELQKKLLWTIGISDTTYKDQFAFSNILFLTELSKGMFQPRKGSNFELNIRASLNLLNDTLFTRRNLRRAIFNFEPGINWVIRNKSNDQSIFEFKVSGEYINRFSNIYAGETRDNLVINGTLRVRIINDIWVPLELRYDPKSGNVFGFLNVKANFSGMGKNCIPKSIF